MTRKSNRRRFLKTAALAGAGLSVLPSGLLAKGRSPNEKLNIGVAGVAGRGGGNLGSVSGENIVALCDVDERHLAAAAQRFPQAKTYYDWRKMLDQKDLDAVVCSTTEHTHAPVILGALRRELHVYCEKPIAHSPEEAQLVRKEYLKVKDKVATQQGTQIHASDNFRRVVELIRAGAIGTVREVHNWCNRVPLGPRYRPEETPPVPPYLHWDLWLGPAPERPYHPTYFTGGCLWWDKWWDFGNGTIGGMGPHITDLACWALDLGIATTVEADSEPKGGYPEVYPEWLSIRWEYPASGDRPPVTVYWHDGGKKPESPPDVDLEKWGGLGMLFIGDKGQLLSDYGQHVLLPKKQYEGFQPPEPTIPSSIGHHQEWIVGAKTGAPTPCNFDYGGKMTENLMAGIVSCRVKQKLDWDSENLRATNCPEADRFIRREYREGWSIR
jgi:predicted dehydrogenase